MLGYLKNTDVSIRLALNPFNWKYIPAVAYEGPTPFYPKRRTYAFTWLFLQAFLDVDNGATDMSALTNLFNVTMDEIDEQSDVGHSVSKARKGDSLLEQGPEY